MPRGLAELVRKELHAIALALPMKIRVTTDDREPIVEKGESHELSIFGSARPRRLFSDLFRDDAIGVGPPRAAGERRNGVIHDPREREDREKEEPHEAPPRARDEPARLSPRQIGRRREVLDLPAPGWAVTSTARAWDSSIAPVSCSSSNPSSISLPTQGVGFPRSSQLTSASFSTPRSSAPPVCGVCANRPFNSRALSSSTKTAIGGGVAELGS